MIKLLFVLLLAGCGTVGPYCNRWEAQPYNPETGQIKQVCKEWRR